MLRSDFSGCRRDQGEFARPNSPWIHKGRPCVSAGSTSLCCRCPKRAGEIAAAKQLGHPWPRTVLLSRQFRLLVSALPKGSSKSARILRASRFARCAAQDRKANVRVSDQPGTASWCFGGLLSEPSTAGRQGSGRARAARAGEAGMPSVDDKAGMPCRRPPDCRGRAGNRLRRMRRRRSDQARSSLPTFCDDRKWVAAIAAKVLERNDQRCKGL